MKFLNYLAAVLLFLVAFFFYRFVFQNAVNVPYFDDYAYLEYIIKFIEAPTVRDFLRELEYKHNGHGVITAKLVFWLDYVLTGQVNYRTLILAGSGLVTLLLFYFWRVLAANQLPIYSLLPIALFLYTPAYHENIFWAAALWQYTASFVIGILTYRLLAHSARWATGAAVLAGFLLTYTNGNGLFGMYIGVLIPLLYHRYRTAGLWLLACVGTTVVFYWYYPFGFGSLNQDKSVKNSLLTLISFFGAGASYLRARLPEVAVLGGAITVSLLGLASWLGIAYLRTALRRFSRSGQKLKTDSLLNTFTQNPENSSLLALLAWLLITGLGVATARAGQGLETPARYMIYSVMAVVSLYVTGLLLLPKLGRWVLAGGMTVFGGLFLLGTYLFAAPEVINFRNSLLADAFSLQHHRRVSGKLETMTNAVTKKYFDESVAKGIYVFPKTAVSLNAITDFDSLRTVNEPMTFRVDTLPAYGGVLIHKIRNDRVELRQDNPDNGLFLVLKNDTATYLTAAKQTPARDRKTFLKTGQYFKEGFEASVFQDNVPAGTYQIGLLFCEDEKQRLIYTSQRLTIPDFRK
ncbi:MAG: hypothetical protein U0X91_05020 [Spirosomataceae bacterium]